MASPADGSDKSLWPVTPNFPPLYSQIDNTGLVLTLSAGDQFSGIDFVNVDGEAQPLTFNTLPSSSPLLLTVGGVKLTKSDNVIVGAEAWRSPTASGVGSAMEGGNGGFTPAVGAPEYQKASPWVRWFQQQNLQSSLTAAWTQPQAGGGQFAWWNSNGQALRLDHKKFSDTSYTFYASSAKDAGLNLDPARLRSMPDLSALAWKDDFLSIKLNGEADLTQPKWTEKIEWKGDGGTSLASPSTAAIVAVANARRRQRGLADLSATELHAILYQLSPGILTDVTKLQHNPETGISSYSAYPGYDFASGLGAVGNTAQVSLADTLAQTVLPSLAQGSNGKAADFLFKPAAMPLLLQKLRGAAGSLQLVSMNGFAVNALLAAEAADPDAVDLHLLETLAQAQQRTSGQQNAVEFSVRSLGQEWKGGNPSSVLRRPLSDFFATEGIAVGADSLLDLSSLADIFQGATGGSAAGQPAWYALIDQTGAADPRTLRLHPFLPNRGTLLGQGGLLSSGSSEQESSLVLSTLQRPLLVADVASSLGDSADGARVALQLRSVSSYSNLYGLYPVLDAQGSLRDGQGNLVAPGGKGYAALALAAAFGDGKDSLLWEAPDHGSSLFTHTRRWSRGEAPGDGRSLLEAVQPGVLYQHVILTSDSQADRQALLARLLSGSLSDSDLSRAWFAPAAANRDGCSHVLGLSDASSFLSLGFEDLAGLGDRDFNDVLASWSVQDTSFSVGSLTLLDAAAARMAQLAAGSSAGPVSTVTLVDTDTGLTLQRWQPFGAADTSGVQLGSGDVNGDGFDDLVAVRATLAPGAAPSLGTEVAVLLGSSAYNPSLSAGTYSPPDPRVLRFHAFPGGQVASGPLALAVRDLNGDGFAEIVVCAAEPDPSRRRLPLEVWSRASGSFQALGPLPLPAGVNLDPTHGHVLAVGDLQGDGLAELLLGDLQGADLFVGTVTPGATVDALSFGSGTVLHPYGSSHTAGVRPTAVTAQQTLIQRPMSFAAAGLPSALSLASGIGSFPTNPLLGSLGTPGALIVQSGNPLLPQPAQVPLSWLMGSSAEPLTPIPWSRTAGTPIFASGGVSYPEPTATQAQDGLDGAPAPLLVAATAGRTDVQLLTYPTSGTDSGQWQPTATASANSLSFMASGNQSSWINAWTYEDVSTNPAAARERYGMVTSAVVSYTTPFVVDANPLQLEAPERLIGDLQNSLDAFTENGVIPWNSNAANPNAVKWSGPSSPNSGAYPYPSGQYPGFQDLPNFQPDFQLVNIPAPGATAEEISAFQVRQFQQRLMNAYFSSLACDYQHHFSPLWYSPSSWPSPTNPTPQVQYLPTPPGRQTQGMDCSHTSSWSYNLAFGVYLPYDISAQVTTSTATADWLTGATLNRTASPASVTTFNSVATALDIYGVNGNASPDQIINYLNANLLPGDIIYLSGKNLNSYIAGLGGDQAAISALQADIATDQNEAQATHVITWVNDNTGAVPFQFVSLPPGAPGADNPQQAFVIDSTGSESTNYLGQAYPNGIQVRQFDASIWYLNYISSVQRWLTPENVATMAQHLPQ